MKVGIVTVHSVPNYGAVLQAYALAHHLRSTGITAETIDYRQPDLAAMYRLKWRIPPPVNQWLRIRRSDAFVHTQLPLGPVTYRSPEAFRSAVPDYDAFITGSDQVWFTGPVQYYDPLYFLDFPAPGKRKISYAASVGGTKDFGEFKPRIREALASYTEIGVRDAHTESLIAPLAPKPPVQVVDPVFLHDFGPLLSADSPSREPYLLVFGNFSGELLASLQAVIAATGIRTVVTLQYPCAAATRRVPAPSPAQWLNWFRHAAFVVTSYFHGAAIAAKFERPFISIPTPGRRIKVATMLEWMGLSDRCFLADPAPESVAARAGQAIDWAATRRLIVARTAHSKAFLRQALGG